MRVITNPLLTERVQYSRSPSRAARRAKMGYRQHFTTRPSKQAVQIGDTLVMHPEAYAALRDKIAQSPPVNPADRWPYPGAMSRWPFQPFQFYKPGP